MSVVNPLATGPKASRWLGPQVLLLLLGKALGYTLVEKDLCENLYVLFLSLGASEEHIRPFPWCPVAELLVEGKEHLSSYIMSRLLESTRGYVREKTESITNDIKSCILELEVVKRHLKESDKPRLTQLVKVGFVTTVIMRGIFSTLLPESGLAFSKIAKVFEKLAYEADKDYAKIKREERESRAAWSPYVLGELGKNVVESLPNVNDRILASLLILMMIRTAFPQIFSFTTLTYDLKMSDYGLYTSLVSCQNEDLLKAFIEALIYAWYGFLTKGDPYNLNVYLRTLASAPIVLGLPGSVDASSSLNSKGSREIKPHHLVAYYYALVVLAPISRGRVLADLYTLNASRSFICTIRPLMLEIIHFYNMLRLVTRISEDERPDDKLQYALTPYIVLDVLIQFVKAQKLRCASLADIAKRAIHILKEYCELWKMLAKIYGKYVKDYHLIADEDFVKGIQEVAEKAQAQTSALESIYSSEAARLSLSALWNIAGNILVQYTRSMRCKNIVISGRPDVVGTIYLLVTG